MFKKRICGSRRVALAIELPGGSEIIDPAIDKENSDLKKYKQSLFSNEHLKLKQGEKATWFTIKPLTRRQKDAAEAFDSAREKSSWFIRCALTRVENFEIEDDEGKLKAVPDLEFEDLLGAKVLTEKWLDSVDFPEDILIALFFMIRTISEVDLPLSSSSNNQLGPSTTEK